MNLLAAPRPSARRTSSASGAEAPAVLHVVGSLEGGGAERCVRDLVPRLVARGATAEIATVYLPNLDAREIARLGCPVHSRPKRPGFDPAHCAWLARTIARSRPAIVHTHMQAGKYVGRLAALLAGVPILVHTEHSPNPLVPGERFYMDFFRRRTAAVVTFGERSADVVRRRERIRNVEIIRNGIAIGPVPDLAERRSARARLAIDGDETIVVAMVGSLQQRKNHRLAFEALALLRDEPGPPLRLVLFGDGPLRAELEARAASLGIAHLVDFHGFRADVARLLPGVDVLASASLAEMAPISLLEGMAAALPLVATPHAGTEDMIVDGVTGLVADWDAPAFASALRRVRAYPAWRAAAGAAGRARVERHFDIETIADRHVALYRRLLSDPASVPRP